LSLLVAAVSAAFDRIEAKNYAARLLEAGMSAKNIRKLAVLFRGKDVRVSVHGG